jgi:DNA invertase Pin-like site-specific DNA recombinase
MRIAIYTRVSTPEQSTDRQVRELRAYAKAREWKIARVIEEIASGASKKRPLREELLQMARTRSIDAVLVQALDRWGRSVQDLVLTMAELETLGVAFIVPGHIDMTTPTGRMLAHFLGAVAEFERELIRERVRSGLAHARSKGKRLGRPRATPVRVEEGIAMLDQGSTYKEASRRSGVSVSTLLRTRRQHTQA